MAETDPRPEISDAKENPAAEASGESLAELFERDPLKLTRSDRDRIISEFRRMRHKFIQKEKEPKKQTKGAQAKEAASQIDIDDMDFKL